MRMHPAGEPPPEAAHRRARRLSRGGGGGRRRARALHARHGAGAGAAGRAGPLAVGPGALLEATGYAPGEPVAVGRAPQPPLSLTPAARARGRYGACMERFRQGAGAVVDQRLAPAGLTRLLGSYGAGRASVLALAAALFVGACVALHPDRRAVGDRSASRSSSPVDARRRRSSARARACCARRWRSRRCRVLAVSGLVGRGRRDDRRALGGAAVPRARRRARCPSARRAAAGCSSRCSRRRPTRSTSRTSTGRYLLVNSATAQLIGRPGREILGRTNAELLPDVAERGRRPRREPCSTRDARRRTRSPAASASDATSCRSRRARFATRRARRSARSASRATSPSSAACRRRARASSTSPATCSARSTSTGACTASTASGSKHLGWTTASCIGASIFDFVPAEDHERDDARRRARRACTARPARRVTKRWRAQGRLVALDRLEPAHGRARSA